LVIFEVNAGKQSAQLKVAMPSAPSIQQAMQRMVAACEKLADDGEARLSDHPLASREKAG
jgi:hypothetical protein